MGMFNRKAFKDWKPGQKVKPRTDTGPGLTKQEFAKETNINVIMARYKATGQLPANMGRAMPVFADVSRIGSFRDAVERVQLAQDTFMSLSAKVRARFGNDAANLVDFLGDPGNREEAIKLGLVDAPVEKPKAEPAKEEPKAPPLAEAPKEPSK